MKSRFASSGAQIRISSMFNKLRNVILALDWNTKSALTRLNKEYDDKQVLQLIRKIVAVAAQLVCG